MKPTAILFTLAAITATASLPAQRKAETRLVNGTIEARITEPNGVDVYTVFQGSGIGGNVEIPATLGNCVSPLFITIGPQAQHNHVHTVDWVDCTNVRRRWEVAVPVSNGWLAGSPLAVGSAYGFGCGQVNPVDLAIDAEPALGTTRTFTVSQLPTSTTIAATFVALDRVPGWGYSLSNLGINAPECYVFIDLVSSIGIGAQAPSAGAAAFSLALPSSPALTGTTIYAQAVALSPGENPAGIVTSNGFAMDLAQ
ncbi:MAG: hypothetical protein KDC98_11355 [Planctomycetes bacterium]|nr:hypothetical protein [Planctomycetota bacterium]